MLPDSPAAERNKEPILAVLREILPPTGTVLEIASGNGQHVVHFAAALPALTWQPTDPDERSRATAAARIAAAGLGNVRAPLALDVHEARWPITAPLAAIVCINMIHISPWSATSALFRGSRALLEHGAPLYLYGPYKEGARTAPSNEAFDESLRARNPAWGVRELDEVSAVAREHGFEVARVTRMPANNLSVVFA
jgi:cyclopropane fatty-acyl-phospholipid synthase-like methyltransferase